MTTRPPPRPPPRAWLGVAVTTSNAAARTETVADRAILLTASLRRPDDSTDTGGSPGTDGRPGTRGGRESRQRAGAPRPWVARGSAREQARKHIRTRRARRPGASQRPNVPIELDVP